LSPTLAAIVTPAAASQGLNGDMDGIRVSSSGEDDQSYSVVHVRGSKHWKGPEYHFHLAEWPAGYNSPAVDVHCLGGMVFAMVLGANLTGWEGLDTNWPVSAMPCTPVACWLLQPQCA
jgi:hypothetical protein